MYNSEFSETRLEGVGIGSANLAELFHEDKKFLEMMNENTKKVDKQLAPKNHKKFPNNRYLTKRRLQYLKGRLIKNPKLFMEYKAFVDDFNNKGFQRSTSEKIQKEKHDIFHTKECTTRAKLGRSWWSLSTVPNLRNYP